MAAQRDGAPAEVKTQAPPVETPPTVAPTQQEVKTEEVAQADPLEGLPAAAREKLAQFDQLVQQNQQLVQQLRETAGRVSKMQSEWDRSRQAQPTSQQPTQTQIAAAAKDPGKWDSLKKDFPEWGEGIEAFVESRLDKVSSGVSPEQIEQLVAQRVDGANAQFEDRLQRELVNFKHPGWEDTVKTPEFAAWYGTQAPEVKNLAASPRAQDAARMLDLYVESKKAPAADVKQTRQQRLEQAVTTIKPGANVQTKTLEDMTPKELWDYYAAQKAASR